MVSILTVYPTLSVVVVLKGDLPETNTLSAYIWAHEKLQIFFK